MSASRQYSKILTSSLKRNLSETGGQLGSLKLLEFRGDRTYLFRALDDVFCSRSPEHGFATRDIPARTGQRLRLRTPNTN